MTTHRNRSEAVWTAEEARVKGRRNRNKAWVLVALVALGAFVIWLAWTRMLGVTDVTYELRTCRSPLGEESTWAEVQAAACDPAPVEGATLELVAGTSREAPASGTGSTWLFENVPVNSPENSAHLTLPEPAGTVVVAEPDNRQIRTAMSSDASGTGWSAYIGSRGPTSYWILVTP